MSIAALTLGITGIVAAIFPPLGLLFCTVGIVLALIAILKSHEQRKKSIAGLVLCLIGLVLNIVMVFTGMMWLLDIISELAQGYGYSY